MDFKEALDRIDELIYLSDINTYELLFVNSYGRMYFGEPSKGVRCYKYLAGRTTPCDFCTNERLQNEPSHSCTCVRRYSSVGNILAHDSLIPYDGRLCRMELAIDMDRYAAKLEGGPQSDLATERTLVECYERLTHATDPDLATNKVLGVLLSYYDADRVSIYKFFWDEHTVSNLYEVCREGIVPHIEDLQSVPLELLSMWVDTFQKLGKDSLVIKNVDELRNDPTRRAEYEFLRPQGITSMIGVPIVNFKTEGLSGFLVVENPRTHLEMPRLLSEVTEIAANEARKGLTIQGLKKRLYLDPLTQAQNRAAYNDALARIQGKEIPVGMASLDLNGLRRINEELGYGCGDSLIRKACDLLREVFGESHIFRVDAGEFAVLWEEVPLDVFSAACARIEERLKKEPELACFIHVWGVRENIDKLRAQGEEAMKAAKNRYYARQQSAERPAYLEELLKEFTDSRFVAYLQPLYSVKEKRVCGAEALARRMDANGGVHPPYEFIDVLEKQGMVSMVDYEIFRQSCELLTRWRKVWPELYISVNFSRVTISEPDYLEQVDRIVSETGVRTGQILVEVTEPSQKMQMEVIDEQLSALKERGFSVALDDMGTEASCLEMLFLPQLDIVKIDRSLISKSENGQREQAVIAGLIDICHRLDISCVAEGIETESQLEQLEKLNCDRLQGYYIGKPMPSGEFFERFAPVENLARGMET